MFNKALFAKPHRKQILHHTYIISAAAFMYSLIVGDLRLRPKMLSPEEHITSPNDVDVINGRGQGVQRHAGNEKYRALVLYNKVCFSLVTCVLCGHW